MLGICAVVLTSYSFARYVTIYGDLHANSVAGISCSFEVNGTQKPFVNAPFMQSVSDSAGAVQMNNYSESTITLKNSDDEASRDYTYSFVLYIPQVFAEHMMFQFVELSDDPKAVNAAAVKASELYMITEDAENSVSKVNDVTNEYRNLIDSEGGELDLSGTHAELENETRTGVLLSTYSSSYEYEGLSSLMCSLTFKHSVELRYYRLTVNLPATDEYVLGKGGVKSFLFRCVPKSALPDDVYRDHAWDGTLKGVLPTAPDGYECRWEGDGLQVKAVNDKDWKDVVIGDCIGLSSPSRINIVFVQKN